MFVTDASPIHSPPHGMRQSCHRTAVGPLPKSCSSLVSLVTLRICTSHISHLSAMWIWVPNQSCRRKRVLGWSLINDALEFNDEFLQVGNQKYLLEIYLAALPIRQRFNLAWRLSCRTRARRARLALTLQSLVFLASKMGQLNEEHWNTLQIGNVFLSEGISPALPVYLALFGCYYWPFWTWNAGFTQSPFHADSFDRLHCRSQRNAGIASGSWQQKRALDCNGRYG